MKRIFFILASALSLAILYLIFNFYILKDRIIVNEINTPLSCDLNLKDCTYNFKNRQILVSINPKPIQYLENAKLKIQNLGNYENLQLKIYGLNMFMGDVVPKIRKINETDYEADFFLASCALEMMRFRAEILKDGKPLGFYFDFELKK